MTRITIRKVGDKGIILDTDIPSTLLPPNAWTSGQNIRFQDGKVVKFKGNKVVFGTPINTPYWALGVPTTTAFYWLYASLSKVAVYEGNIHTDITRLSGGYSAQVEQLWNGGLLGGVPIINNSYDPPQFWSTVTPVTPLADLTNWPVGMTCKVIKPFKNFLISLGVNKSGVDYPHMIKWSHPADPGTVPISWDETDPTKDAGEVDLSDVSAGIIRDGLPLKNFFIVYKDGSTWAMQYIGGTYIFKIFNLFTTSGIMSTDCVAALPQGKGHFVLTGDDLIIHDGQKVTSLLDKRMRKYLVRNIDGNNFNKSFCTVNFAENEMWACFPETGYTTPNKAFVYNIVDKTLGLRDISGITSLTSGIIDETDAAASWDGDTGTWDGDTSQWGGQLFTPFIRRLLGANPSTGKLEQFDTTNQFDGVNVTSSVTRIGMPWGKVDKYNNPVADFESRKLVTRVWPKITGGPVDIRVGSQEEEGGVITWSVSQSFISGDEFIDPEPAVSGRLLCIEFSSNADVEWSLDEYALEVKSIGKVL